MITTWHMGPRRDNLGHIHSNLVCYFEEIGKVLFLTIPFQHTNFITVVSTPVGSLADFEEGKDN